MKRLIACAMIGMVMSLGCARTEKIDGVTVEAYGIFCLDDEKDGVRYSVNWTGVVLGAVFAETLIVPLIVAGWYLFEPEEAK